MKIIKIKKLNINLNNLIILNKAKVLLSKTRDCEFTRNKPRKF